MNIPFVDIHTHHSTPCHEETRSILSLRPEENSENPFYSLSLHPWYISDLSDERILWIKTFLEKDDPKLCALGEVGLDRLSSVSVEIQREYFIKVVTLSEEYQKPLILHVVKAWDELIQVKRELKPRMPWIVHGFRGNPTLAQQLIKENLQLSFGHRFNPDSIRLANLSNILFLETDHSHISISNIYKQISQTLKCSIDDLKADIWTRTLEIFPNIKYF